MNDQGMRFKRIEVRNFGTWNGASAHVFNMNRKGAVIAGENGSGKSTLMDAIVALFSWGNRGVFNAAAAAKERSSRNIIDYYKGTHGSTEDPLSKRTKPIVLRNVGDEATTMMILAVFENARGEVFTVARSLYVAADNSEKWRYFTSKHDLSINAHFPGYPTARDINARAERFTFEHHPNLASYWSAIAEGLGMPSPDYAKRAFQTMITAMAVPKSPSVTDFVRSYILPPSNLLEDGENYVQLLQNHGVLQEEIKRTKRRADSLAEVVDIIHALEKDIAEHRLNQMSKTRIAAVHQFALMHNFRTGRAKKIKEHRSSLIRIKEINERLSGINTAIDVIKEARIKGGTADMARLRKELLAAERVHAQKHDQLAKLLSFTESFMAGENPKDEAGWNRIVKTANQVISESDELIRSNEALIDNLNDDLREAEAELRQMQAEYSSLINNNSGVDPGLVENRKMIAEKIGVSTNDLPFFAELVQVKADEAIVWETAINKLLRSVASVILVPEAHYAKAKTALKSVSGRSLIRLQEVWEDDMGIANGSGMSGLGPRAAARLIEVRTDSPFGVYVESTLAQKANHICISDDDVHSPHKRAISPSGVIISSETTTEKDNRSSRNILGWSVEGRAEALKAKIDNTQIAMRSLRDKKEQALSGIDVHRKKQKGAEFFLMTAPARWADVNPDVSLSGVNEIRQSLAIFERKEQESGLANEESDLLRELAELNEEKDRLNRSTGAVERTISGLSSAISEVRAELSRIRDSGLTMSVNDYKGVRGLVRQTIANAGINSKGLIISQDRADINTIFHAVSNTVATTMSRLDKEIEVKDTRLGNRAATHLAVFHEEAGKLSLRIKGDELTSYENRQAWVEKLVEVREKDLKAAEGRAKEYSRASLSGALTQIRLGIKQYHAEVTALLGGINKSMAGNVYNPRSSSTAKISHSYSKDPYHQDLDKLLDSALSEMHGKPDAEFYEDAAKIADYIKDDGSHTQKLRRDSLSNLANRYTARVVESVKRDDGSYGVIRDIESSGALSGGESERLNVFLLSAALETVFKSKTDPTLSLGVFVVDEAFSKSTDESTRAAIDVVSSFGHQIIVATPMAKLLPFESVSEHVFIVSRPTNAQSVKDVIEMRTLLEGVNDEA